MVCLVKYVQWVCRVEGLTVSCFMLRGCFVLILVEEIFHVYLSQTHIHVNTHGDEINFC